MKHCAILLVVGLLSMVGISQTMAQSQEDIAEPVLLNPAVMPPEPDIDTTEAMSENTAELAEKGDEIKPTDQKDMELITRGIYQCLDRGKVVFVDEENRSKYGQCTQIRAPHYQRIDERFTEPQRASCSGAITYKGNTYIFNDQEPCPIPEAIFEARKPIEANPEYYTQPSS